MQLVLILSSYMAALWLARLGVNARIIDKRPSQIFAGQADGLQVSMGMGSQCRSPG